MSTIISINPTNYEKIGETIESTEQEIVNKVKKAHSAKIIWQQMELNKRIELLKKVYDEFESRTDEIASIASMEMGFPKQQLLDFDLGEGLNYFKWNLDNANKIISPKIISRSDQESHTIYYEPLGVVAVIQPWNFPFCQWSWSVVQNLIVGNTVVFKHSTQCVLTGKIIEEIINKVLPDGVFSEVYGDSEVGNTLINQNINLIYFTGSTQAGRKIFEFAGKKFIKSIIELGGSAPGIVFDDININEVASCIYDQRFINNGQVCDGLKRLIVHESIFDDVVLKLKDIVESKKIGDPNSIDTDLGPVSSEKQLNILHSQVEDALSKGANIITGALIPEKSNGAFFEPTILTNINPSMRIWKEEVFGPILPVVSFKTEDEAIYMANDTQYGLGGYVYSKDVERAARIAKKINTGMVSINGTNYIYPFNPFGGHKSSGIGKSNGRFGFEDIAQIKLVSMKIDK